MSLDTHPDDGHGVLGDAVLARVLGLLPDALVVVDRGGIIRYWNAGAERIFGHPAALALGVTLDLIIPERLRARHEAGFIRAVREGTSRYGAADLLAVPALAADGRTLSIEFSIVLLPGPDGGVSYVGALIRDVTERRRQ